MENQAQNLDVQLRSAIKGSQNVLERYKKLLLRVYNFQKEGVQVPLLSGGYLRRY